MTTRYHVLGSGHVVEVDCPDRDPRLIGKLSWPNCPLRPPVDLLGSGGQQPDWPGPDWYELVADCECDDCQAQREAALN